VVVEEVLAGLPVVLQMKLTNYFDVQAKAQKGLLMIQKSTAYFKMP
jgi:hypothetical protein